MRELGLETEEERRVRGELAPLEGGDDVLSDAAGREQAVVRLEGVLKARSMDLAQKEAKSVPLQVCAVARRTGSIYKDALLTSADPLAVSFASAL